nr:uncharacterized protein LOC122269097 [Parasteatoda tepidariorum]
MAAKKVNKKYLTSFNQSYSEEFPGIIPSKKGSNYAFCTFCSVDFSIMHKGKGDISAHVSRQKHVDNQRIRTENKKIDFSVKKNDNSAIRAEALFTSFIVEHNIPINVADHVGPLMRNMFPDSKIAKEYSCARTKTTAIVGEMARSNKLEITNLLKSNVFSISTDGSNKGDSKLFPIVATFYDEKKTLIDSCLISVPALEGDATGVNISKLILDTLTSNEIPLANCLALGVDNAPVMTGKKNGVAGMLTKDIPDLFVQGCLCHLLNLAAEKGAKCLPINIEEYIVDIFFYLEKSVKRKERLKKFQELHSTEVRKILKHVGTRWLSVGRCLSRVLQQWEPLTSFFKEEVKSTPSVALPNYVIPKKKSNLSHNEARKIIKKREDDNVMPPPSKKPKVEDFSAKNEILSREERIFMFLSSDLNKAFVHFLLFIVPLFENLNLQLQSNIPKIHVMGQLMNNLFKDILSKFMLPNIVKSQSKSSLLDVNFYLRENQKDDCDLVIGHSTLTIVETLKGKDKDSFYCDVRKYFVKVCDYMRQKFPYNDEVVINAEVANLDNVETTSFSSIRFFINRFPQLLQILGGDKDSVLDSLQSQFSSLQLESIDCVQSEERMDSKWAKLSVVFENKYAMLSKFMLSILAIPHSNAECERIFSLVTKAHTQFRSSMSVKNLENLITVKSRISEPCYKQKFDDEFFKRAKTAIVNHNNN